jgi:SAM-dependent methyltransferase
MKRVPTPELLDTDNGTPEEVAGSLADLRMFNLRFGGRGSTLRMFERILRAWPATSLSLLEVASGGGDVPRWTRESLAARGIRLDLTLLDRAASHLGNGARALAADALALPFRDDSFDLVGCSLFAHHLPPEQIIPFANESLRVCRHALLINDLIRHPLHLALTYAGFPLYRSRLTRHDAPASVKQAYTVAEMQALLRQTSAARIEIDRYYLYRMGVIAWKH